MKKYLIYRNALIFLLLLLCIPAFAANDKGFLFIQIADTQLGFSTGNKSITQEIDNFKKAVDDINRLKPAFVIISGDMTNRKNDPDQINAFWEVAKQIQPDIRLYLVPGNHDIAPAKAADIAAYRGHYGDDYYSFTYNNSYFIVLDSSLIFSPESDPEIRQTQKQWLIDELAEAKKNNANHIFVLTHHPWFVGKPDEPDAYHNIPLAERMEYLALMEQYGVDYTLAGHLHLNAQAKYDGISLIATSALAKSLGKDREGFRIFKVYKDNVKQNYYPLDKVPEQIKLNK